MNTNFLNTGAVARGSVKTTGEMNVTHPVKKTMEDNENDNDFEEDTLRGVYKLNKTIVVDVITRVSVLIVIWRTSTEFLSLFNLVLETPL